MECPKCKSNSYKDGTFKGVQKYRCKNPSCKFNFRDTTVVVVKKTKLGMSLNDFRDKFDVEFIVDKTLKALVPDVVYEKQDIYKLTGLRAGFPGLSATLEDKKFEQYRGRIGGRDYFSHPDTIKELINNAILQ